MSIEVQCPNPDCGRVHRVKNSWAGKSGACPACGSAIRVPDAPAAVLSRAAAPHPAPAHQPRPAPKPHVETVAGAGNEDTLAWDLPEKAHKHKPHPPADDDATEALEAVTEEPAVAEEEVAEDAEVAEDEDSPPAARRGLSWVTTLFYLLAILSLLGVASIPFLNGPTATLSGPIPPGYKPPPEVKTEWSDTQRTVLVSIPAAGAGLAAIGLLVSLLTRRYGVVALLTCYPAVILSGLLLWFLAVGVVLQLDKIEEMEAKFKTEVGRVAPGLSMSMSPGQDLMIPAGSAAVATLLFSVTILLIHRAAWARSLFVILAILGLAVGAALIYFGRKF